MEELTAWLQSSDAAGRLRRLRPIGRRRGGRLQTGEGGEADLLDFSSNDYLALSIHPAVLEGSRQALLAWGAGAGASRLMSGDLALFHQLEEVVAAWKEKEAALVFSSGYGANVGIITALAGRGDVVFTDRLAHASIYDGCRQAGARIRRFRHNDPEHLEHLLRKERGRGRALIAVESIYSMDGDRAPLGELVVLKERYAGRLLVDEAHATGVFGANGSGVVAEEGLAAGVDLLMGTFGKALGSYGAYVAASREMIEYLLNRARSFIYSTALPPAVAGASLAAVELVKGQPELRLELQQKVHFFKSLLKEGGITADLGPSQIVPLIVGEVEPCLALAETLQDQGLFVTAIRPPTVQAGSARLRFSITRHQQEFELRHAAGLILAGARDRAPHLFA